MNIADAFILTQACLYSAVRRRLQSNKFLLYLYGKRIAPDDAIINIDVTYEFRRGCHDWQEYWREYWDHWDRFCDFDVVGNTDVGNTDDDFDIGEERLGKMGDKIVNEDNLEAIVANKNFADFQKEKKHIIETCNQLRIIRQTLLQTREHYITYLKKRHLELYSQIHEHKSIIGEYKSIYSTIDEYKSKQKLWQCIICLDAPKNTLLIPCNHVLSCEQCAACLKVCPVCRRNIEKKIKFFNI